MTLKNAFAIAALMLPAASFAVDPATAPETPENRLAYFCPLEKSLPDRTAHKQCLQETIGQIMDFSEAFHASLFTAKSIKADVHRYFDMLSAWEDQLVTPWNQALIEQAKKAVPDIRDLPEEEILGVAVNTIGVDRLFAPSVKAQMDKDAADFRTIRGYAKHCHLMIVDVAFNADASLDHSHTTAYSLPTYCLESAIRLSQRFNLPMNTAEAARLKAHMDGINLYYKNNPVIPPALPK